MHIQHSWKEGTNTISLYFKGHLTSEGLEQDEVKNDFFSVYATSRVQQVSLFLDDETVIAMADQFASIARSLCKEEVAS